MVCTPMYQMVYTPMYQMVYTYKKKYIIKYIFFLIEKKKKKDLGILLFGKANPLPYSFLLFVWLGIYRIYR